MIGQPQYAFAPTGFAGGGLASLPVRRFQSGGSTGISVGTAPAGGGFFDAIEGTPTIGGYGITPATVFGLVAPQLSVPLSVIGAARAAYNAFTAKQDPAPIEDAKVDPYSPPPPGLPVAPPAAVSVESISPGYTEPGKAQAVVDAMIATQQEEQAQAQAEAQAAQTAAMAAQQAVDASMDVSSAPSSDGGGGGGGAPGAPGNAVSIGGSMDAAGVSNTGSEGVGNEGSGTGNDAGTFYGGGRVTGYQQGGQVMNYAQGGLPSLANNMASRGRYGDSMLVHMSPQEVQGLQQLAMANGTSLSINPYTGMPEAFSLKKIFKSIAKFVAPILPFIPIPGLAGLSPLITKALLSTAVGGFSGKKGGFDLKRGLMSGLTTYGIGSLAQGAGAAANANAGANVGDIGAQQAADAAININATPVSASAPAGAMMDAATGSVLPAPDAAAAAAPKFMQSMPEGSSLTDYVTQTGRNIQTAGQGLYDTVTGAPGARAAFTSGQAINPFTDKPIGVGTAAGAAFAGVTGAKTLDELEKAKDEADKILKDAATRTEEEKEYARNILRNYPVEYRRITGQEVTGFGMAAGGMTGPYVSNGFQEDNAMVQDGIPSLAKGGLPPRYLRGGGDGMSDSIRANIEGKQEARLADGEFVVPADVVSHLGNGSSNAGAKRLYAMMDRVRRSRTGKTRQAPEVNTRRMMPA